ncbi:hypothetical protein [Hymenobacter lucidus]|uniref:Lipoprotein n=1 Tax=Hymenobacter lucidus TaxID=2880930 RepID=A0ABS8AW18_9BACT|nr:hypothetical protein [Hymenobacter lucidus]MCB2409966.1 hypothetical protein [Hymenobacter lucidus]
MINRYLVPKQLLRLLPLAALALTGCENETVPGPESGTDYYPLEIGSYRVYAVADTIWDAYQRKVSSYQFRETITDQIPDATGQPSYRVVRAKRVLATDAWRDDSVMVLTKVRNAVLLTRNNRRSVELIFPVRKDRTWDMYAFSFIDTTTVQEDQNRQYEAVDEPFQATAGGKDYLYPHTLTTSLIVDNGNPYGSDDEYYRSTYSQVYAKGMGPVYRVRRRFNYCDQQSLSCSRSNTRIYKGQARVEVLIEQGKL